MKKIMKNFKKIFFMVIVFFMLKYSKILAYEPAYGIREPESEQKFKIKLNSLDNILEILPEIIKVSIFPIIFIIGAVVYFKKSSQNRNKKLMILLGTAIIIFVLLILLKIIFF